MSIGASVKMRLRSLRPVWLFYNLLHYSRLRANADHYRRFGIRKSVVQSISHKDISAPAGEVPWLDRPDAKKALEAHPEFASLPPTMQDGLRRWVDDGYLVLERFFDEAAVASINAEVEQLVQAGQLTYHYRGNRIMNAVEDSEAVAGAVRHPELERLLTFLLGRDLRLFQTINFFEGSEQRPHSDSFHMTTEPFGYLVAIWVALEDVSPEAGPLVYYPGSHKLPYIMSEDFETGNSSLFLGQRTQSNYEDKIQQVIAEAGLEAKEFLARAGDVLVWHANLLHGGLPITRGGATRKSLVAHFFAEGVLCYHEVTARPALLAG